MLFTTSIDSWNMQINANKAEELIDALESGHIIYCPLLKFNLEPDEIALFNLDLNKKGFKNISYQPQSRKVSGLEIETATTSVKKMLERYYQSSIKLIEKICPQYQVSQHTGRTSYRPVEIKGRKTSYRKDDTRLHVDAFPSTPVNNFRILRVFTNINPYGEPRHWHTGEAFDAVMRQFLPKTRHLLPFEANILYRLKLTKKKRLPYDHYMLKVHNAMKADIHYQNNVNAESILFPPNSTWLVYTDLVSHAALSGRFVLEQTFYPPIEKMKDKQLSPQYQIQKFFETQK